MNRLTEHEKQERERLTLLWVYGLATKSQMIKCMELNKKIEYEARSK